MNTPRQIAEAVFEKWTREGTLETGWMNEEDREPFIAAIERVIKDDRAEMARQVVLGLHGILKLHF